MVNLFGFPWLFAIQFVVWLGLSLRETGRKVTLAWALLVTVGWALNVYFKYLPLVQTGDLNLGIFAVRAIVMSGVDLAVNLVLPPWAGLIVGILATQQS